MWRSSIDKHFKWAPLLTYFAFLAVSFSWYFSFVSLMFVRSVFIWTLPILALSIVMLALFYRRHIHAAAFLLPAILVSIAVSERTWVLHSMIHYRP